MKYLFVILGLLLTAALWLTHATEPQALDELPVIHWVIDPAPARGQQIHGFHLWQIRENLGRTEVLVNAEELAKFRDRHWSPPIRRAIAEGNPLGESIWTGEVNPDRFPITVRTPKCEMRLDAASNDLNKKLVQGVSGVAGDVIEAYSGGEQMRYLASSGMLLDLTEKAEAAGIGPAATYPALRPALFFQGRQYAFPRNVAQAMYWVNKDTFARLGQPMPDRRMSFEQFEEAGRAFVEAANPPGGRRTVFFADQPMLENMRRSLGVGTFNATLTAATLNDPRAVRVLELARRWTHDLHLFPSAAERSSFDTAGGWGGADIQLFAAGQYGLYSSGRYALMLLRQLKEPIQLAVIEPPNGGLPNTVLTGGQSTVFVSSKHPDLAIMFLSYMASDLYNQQIIESGVALPPRPEATLREDFLHPPEHPNEWGVHEVFRDSAAEIAIVKSLSPYVLPVVVQRIETQMLEAVMAGTLTPQQAAEDATRRINDEIARNVRDDPALAQQYEKDLTIQKQIDTARTAGQAVPESWLLDPYHREVYRRNGWIAAGEDREGLP